MNGKTRHIKSQVWLIENDTVELRFIDSDKVRNFDKIIPQASTSFVSCKYLIIAVHYSLFNWWLDRSARQTGWISSTQTQCCSITGKREKNTDRACLIGEIWGMMMEDLKNNIELRLSHQTRDWSGG